MVIAIVEEGMVLGAVREESAQNTEWDAKKDVGGVVVLCSSFSEQSFMTPELQSYLVYNHTHRN